MKNKIKFMLNRVLRLIFDFKLFMSFSLMVVGCSEAELYHREVPPLEADRVAISGKVCTEDPEIKRFPARLILLVDHAQGPVYSEYDPGQLRLQMLNGLVQQALAKPEYSIAVIGYAGTAHRLAPEEGLFTRNPGELLNAITQFSLPDRCIGEGRCRDYQSGLDAARTLIEDDLTLMEAGARAVTQYTVLWVAAGPQEPLAKNRDCCPLADRTCQRADGGDLPSPRCQAQLDIERVQQMRDLALSKGAGGFQLHVLHLAAEEQTINRQMAQLFEQLTFAGSGRYARFGAPENIDIRAVSIFDRPNDLEAAQVVVVNQSVAPRRAGLLPDSDGDGLADEEEDLDGDGVVDEGESDPLLKDSDGDGISDLIEARVGLSVQDVDEPVVCEDLRFYEGLANADRDLDGLTECEERLMGTDPSLTDTDGDNLPDGLELKRGTDHLNPDSAEDFDEDGVSNGDEMREGTDPRSIDEAQRLGLAARYDLTREGRQRDLSAAQLQKLEGVRITTVSDALDPGLATIQWKPSDSEGELGTLQLKTPQETVLGVATTITGSGRYRVYGEDNSAQAPEGMEADQVAQAESDQWIEVEINEGLLPDVLFTEEFLLRLREQSCIHYTVRNLRLVEVAPTERDRAQGRRVGANELFIYFAQKPTGQSEVPGRFKIGRIPIYYEAPARRSPSGSTLQVDEADMISPSFSETLTLPVNP